MIVRNGLRAIKVDHVKQKWRSEMTGVRFSNFSEIPDEALLRFSEFEPMIPLRKSAWWRGVSEGRFPKPVKLGRTSAWRAKDIKKLLEHGSG